MVQCGYKTKGGILVIKQNSDIREKAKEAGIRMWQLADALGIADTTLCRKLRKEFSPEDKKKALEIIERLAREA